MDRRQPRGWNIRLLAIGACLVALSAGYVLLLRHFNVSELPGERHFGAADHVVPAGEVYLEPISIDALNDAMQMRAYLSPSITESKDVHGPPSRDLTLLVTHDKTVEEVKLAAADHIASSTFEIDLNDGTVAHYPLDAYRTQFGVQLLDGKSSLRLPVRVTMWEGVLGYNLHTTNAAQADSQDVELTTTIKRSGAFALFGLCAYAAMIVLGCCAVVVGVLTFIEVRPAETTLIGSLAAIAFALPVLRNALPGSPPLGVEADMWVFLWAELAAVLALAVVVFKWARAGPRP
jgi:Domain of unknown function (DUF4436)